LIRIDPFSLLPREVNLRILGYLDAISLGRAAQVSKSWKALADDDLLWRRMCGQHIDRKCEKCGWGLPLLERRRLRGELNEGSPSVAVGVGKHEHHHHEHEPSALGKSREHTHKEAVAVASREETLGRKAEKNAVGSGLCDLAFTGLGVKRGSEDGIAIPSPAMKRVKISSLSDSESESVDGSTGKGKGRMRDETESGSLSREVRMTRPWKSVYCERLVVERNWRKGRCKMTTLKVSTRIPRAYE
jgi:F-box/WD-40 domain protein MET30